MISFTILLSTVVILRALMVASIFVFGEAPPALSATQIKRAHIVVVARNNAATIQEAVYSALALDLQNKLTIIVQPSRDDTAHLARALAGMLPDKKIRIIQKRKYMNTARSIKVDRVLSRLDRKLILSAAHRLDFTKEGEVSISTIQRDDLRSRYQTLKDSDAALRTAAVDSLRLSRVPSATRTVAYSLFVIIESLVLLRALQLALTGITLQPLVLLTGVHLAWLCIAIARRSAPDGAIGLTLQYFFFAPTIYVLAVIALPLNLVPRSTSNKLF